MNRFKKLLPLLTTSLLLAECAYSNPPHPVNSDQTPKNFVGTQTYIYWNQWDLGEFEKTVAFAASMGMKYMRIDAVWNDIERDGKIDPANIKLYQQRQDVITKHGMKAIFVATTTHDQHPETEWTKNRLGYPINDADRQAYATFVAAFAKAMGPRVMIEYSNEPNLLSNGPNKADQYAAMVKAAQAELKAQNISVQTLGPAVSTWQDGNPDHTAAIPFMKEVAADGVTFNIATIHLYDGVGEPDALLPKLRQALAIAKQHGEVVAVTESGYSSAPNCADAVSPEEQGRRDVDAVKRYHMAGAKFVIIYEAGDRKDWNIDHETGQKIPRAPAGDQGVEGFFGLGTYDQKSKKFKLKPAGAAIKAYVLGP